MHDRNPRQLNPELISRRGLEPSIGAPAIVFLIAAIGFMGTALDCRAQSNAEAPQTNSDSQKQGVIKMPGVIIQKRASQHHKTSSSHHHGAAQQALVKAAAAKCETGDYLHAIADCNQALSMGAYAPAYYQRGLVRQKIGQYKEALADYNVAIRIDPKHTLAHVNRGWCRRKLGDVPGSIQDFTQAIFIDPTCSQAFSNRAASKVQMGDLQGAFADSNEALRLNPDAAKQVAKVVSKPYEHSALTADKYESGGKRSRAVAPELARLNNQAVQFINNKNFPGAIKILETIVKNDPGYEYARNNLSIAYNNFGLSMSNKYPVQSINQFRTALFFAPGENTTRDNLDAMLKHVGQDPRSADVREQLGDELRTTGDLKAAYVEYTEALRLKNDPALRKKLAQVLTALDGPVEHADSIAQQDEEPTIIGFGTRSGNVSVASARRRIKSGTAGDDEKIAVPSTATAAEPAQTTPSEATQSTPSETEQSTPSAALQSTPSDAAQTPSSDVTTLTPPAQSEVAPLTRLGTTPSSFGQTAIETRPAEPRPAEPRPAEPRPVAAALPEVKAAQAQSNQKKLAEASDSSALKLTYERPVLQPDAFKSDGVVEEQPIPPINPIGTLHTSLTPAATKVASAPVPAASAASPAAANAQSRARTKEQRSANIAQWELSMKTGVQELDRGNYPAAEAAFSQSVKLAEMLNNDSFLLVRSLDMLTTAVMSQGRLSEAANSMKRALTIRETTLLPDHPEIARSYERYARLLAKTGNRGEAAVYENRAAEIWKKRAQEDEGN